MSNTKKVVLVVTAVLVVCLIGAGAILLTGYGGEVPNSIIPFRGGTAVRIDESEAFSIDGIGSINVNCVIGRVIIEKGQPHAELVGSIRTNVEKDKYLVVERSGDELSIRFDAQTSFPDYLNGEITMRVWLPDGLDVFVTGASASIDVAGLHFGDASLQSISGAVTAADCAGQSLRAASTSGSVQVQSADFDRVDVSSTSGGVKVNDVPGDLTVNSVSGGVRVENAQGPVSIGNTSGSVYVSQMLSEPEVNVSTISGSVTISLHSDAAFGLTARSTSGSLTTDYEVTLGGSLKSKIVGTDVQGSINGGGGNVFVKTISGSIRVNKE